MQHFHPQRFLVLIQGKGQESLELCRLPGTPCAREQNFSNLHEKYTVISGIFLIWNSLKFKVVLSESNLFRLDSAPSRESSLWASWYRKYLVLLSKSTHVNDANTLKLWWLHHCVCLGDQSWRCRVVFCGVTHMTLRSPIWNETPRPSFWLLFLCQLLQPCCNMAGLRYLGATLQVEQMLVYLLGGNLLNKS